jgi:hypothetical protein
MTIKEIRATGVKISLRRCFICWMGNHTRLSFILTVISAYLTAYVPDIVISIFYCATGVFWPYCIHEISLTIASGAASLLEQRIVGMVPNIAGKLKGAVYPILKRCCHSKRMDALNVYIH